MLHEIEHVRRRNSLISLELKSIFKGREVFMSLLGIVSIFYETTTFDAQEYGIFNLCDLSFFAEFMRFVFVCHCACSVHI